MFDQYFEVFLADNAAGKDINYKIRYQVYCLETKYEDQTRFPDKRESDAFDEHSVHFIARARLTGEWIAALRLVVRPFDSLPLNSHANIDFSVFNSEIAGDVKTSQTTFCAEVSRLCVVSNYRRRSQERKLPYQLAWDPDHEGPPKNDADPGERRKAPWLMLGLINAARDYSDNHNIRYWFFLVADSLARIMEGLGFGLTRAGPPCDHRGIRRPYFRDLNTNYENIAQRLPIVYDMFTKPSGYRLYSEFCDERDQAHFVATSNR